MNEIKWQEPPAATRRDWAGIRGALVARPGEWALVAEEISRAQASVVKRPGFETRVDGSHYEGNRRVDLYMRFIGEVSA